MMLFGVMERDAVLLWASGSGIVPLHLHLSTPSFGDDQ